MGEMVAASLPHREAARDSTKLEPGARGTLKRIDLRLERLAATIHQARFRESLDDASILRNDLAELDDLPARELDTRIARLEILAATTHLALGALEEADGALRRVLQLIPEYELDARAHSPKLVRMFEQIRRTPSDTDLRGPFESSELTRPGDLPPARIQGKSARNPSSTLAFHPTIVCRLLVDATGAVVDARVYRTRRELASFEQAALDAAYRFRFKPALRAGRPVSAWIHWPVQFD